MLLARQGERIVMSLFAHKVFMKKQSSFTKHLALLVVICFFMIGGLIAFSSTRQNTSELPPIKTQISIESDKLTPQKPALVTISIENLSEEKIELRALASFELLKNSEESIARNFTVRGDSYWSPFDLVTGRSKQLVTNPEMLKKGIVEGGVVPATMQLEGKGTKTMNVNLTELFWNASMSSTWPYENLFKAIPKGRYWLAFELENKGHIRSNQIDVTVE
jgi:hypothetical protein